MTTITLGDALARGHGTWRSFTCPAHPDANPSARVNVSSGKWVCMVCHARGTTAGYVPDPILALDEARALLDSVSLEKPESWLDQFDSGPVHPYWLSRFDEASCRTFRLGWDGNRGKPCYPVRDRAGRPLGVVHRSLDGDGPKYKYPRGVRTAELLFGVREAVQVDVVFLVEGAMDVVAAREAGHDALGTYGARLHERQAREIASLNPAMVWVAYDMDKPGEEGAKDALRTLRDAGIMCGRANWHPRYKDLGEMGLEARRATLSKVLASISTHRLRSQA